MEMETEMRVLAQEMAVRNQPSNEQEWKIPDQLVWQEARELVM